MHKAKALRIGGFVGALCASAALIGTAVSGTGAYFTDSANGSLNASAGHLTLNVNPSQLNMNFQNLVPGEDQTMSVNYATDSSTNEDVWLVFNQSDPAYGAFSGSKGAGQPYPDGGLGRFGHFAAGANGTTLFESYNLQIDPANPSGANQAASASDCGVNANGDGGSSAQVVHKTDILPYCGVPGAILLAQNLPNGATGHIDVTFGITKKWTAQSVPVANLPFKIVATQHGVNPTNEFNTP